MLRRPWTAAQFALAVVLLVISLIGVIGILAFDNADTVFSVAGGIQAFGVFPGLVLSLALNGLLMGLARAPLPNLAQRILLIIEFVVIGFLLLFHFYTDPDGYTFGLAILTWPLLIALAIAIGILAVVRLAGTRAVDPAAS